MPQNLEKNKIRASMQKARSQDLHYLTISRSEKDSKKNTIREIERFIGKGNCEVVIIKK